jgi:hypothetical protein
VRRERAIGPSAALNAVVGEAVERIRCHLGVAQAMAAHLVENNTAVDPGAHVVVTRPTQRGCCSSVLCHLPTQRVNCAKRCRW